MCRLTERSLSLKCQLYTKPLTQKTYMYSHINILFQDQIAQDLGPHVVSAHRFTVLLASRPFDFSEGKGGGGVGGGVVWKS